MVAAVPAMAQSKPMMHGHAKPPTAMHAQKMDSMNMNMMMKGLSASEKKTAMDHMKKMTPAEHAVAMKAMHHCMSMGMPKGKMTEKMMQDRMMMGLSANEKKTMTGMMKKMTPAEHAVAKKMMMNCMMAHKGTMTHMSHGGMMKKGGK